jgi:glycosyltransferase involved in cell wall biosynthesis
MDGVKRFSVPSRSVQKRLRDFNRVDRVIPFHPGVTSRHAEPGVAEAAGRHHVLCVSPHELPRRTELFVQAAHLLSGLTAVCVGEGSRLEWARRVDRSLDRVSAVDPEMLWRRPPDGSLPLPRWQGAPLVTFIPWTRASQLGLLYRQAKCIVAPAIEEDYGLTILEAMSWGTPAVVCKDGGSLTEIVETTGAGLVVEPEPRAIAEAVRKLAYDNDLAARCRANGLAAVEHRFNWSRAFEQLDFALARVAEV